MNTILVYVQSCLQPLLIDVNWVYLGESFEILKPFEEGPEDKLKWNISSVLVGQCFPETFLASFFVYPFSTHFSVSILWEAARSTLWAIKTSPSWENYGHCSVASWCSASQVLLWADGSYSISMAPLLRTLPPVCMFIAGNLIPARLGVGQGLLGTLSSPPVQNGAEVHPGPSRPVWLPLLMILNWDQVLNWWGFHAHVSSDGELPFWAEFEGWWLSSKGRSCLHGGKKEEKEERTWGKSPSWSWEMERVLLSSQRHPSQSPIPEDV